MLHQRSPVYVGITSGVYHISVTSYMEVQWVYSDNHSTNTTDIYLSLSKSYISVSEVKRLDAGVLADWAG
jgi:hypothetical protein